MGWSAVAVFLIIVVALGVAWFRSPKVSPCSDPTLPKTSTDFPLDPDLLAREQLIQLAISVVEDMDVLYDDLIYIPIPGAPKSFRIQVLDRGLCLKIGFSGKGPELASLVGLGGCPSEVRIEFHSIPDTEDSVHLLIDVLNELKRDLTKRVIAQEILEGKNKEANLLMFQSSVAALIEKGKTCSKD